MKDFAKINLEKDLKIFLDGNGGKNKGRHPNERYASFDYCFNYFQSFKKRNRINDLADKENLQQSCFQLGFYLASWGMLRGSSFLLEKSMRHLSKLIQEISNFDESIWDIDVDSYTDDNIQLLLKSKEKIKIALGKDKNASDTLTTKIMLGVFGNVPAFDNYFRNGFGFSYCGNSQLKKISKFYQIPGNKKIIDKYNNKIFTFDFNTGKETEINYTRAKIVDMIGFIEGQKKSV